MKTLPRPLTRSSHLIFAGYIAAYLFLVGFSWFDALLVLGVEALSYLLLGYALSRYFFPWLFPKYQFLTPHFDESSFLDQSIEGQVRTLQVLFSFPASKALFLLATGLLRVLPAGLALVYWGQHGLPQLTVWTYFLALEVLAIPLYAVLALVELHIAITEMVKELHRKHDLGAIFKVYNLPRPASVLTAMACSSITIALGICFVIFATQGGLLFTAWDQFSVERAIGFLVLWGLILSRVYYLYRSYLTKGIFELEQGYLAFGTGKKSYMSLASASLLAQFQGTFNSMVTKLEKYESGIMAWTLKETEDSRFRVVGEISAVVGHSLKGPIHAVSFSLDEIVEKCTPDETLSKHLKYIRENINRIGELSNSLNTNLRNPDGRKYNHLPLIHREVINLLKYEFMKVEEVCFELLDFDGPRRIKAPHRDIVHIVYNLYKNSMKNFEENQVSSPHIAFKFVVQVEQMITFQFMDNGSGLSREDFNNFTTLNFDTMGESSFRRGLGLRLTKQLVEECGGALAYATNPWGQGTSFLLTLPS